MNSTTTTTTLQDYAPSIPIVLVDVVMSAFLLGSLTVLSMVSAAHLIHRGIKRPSTAFMLGSLVVLYASTGVYFGVHVAYFVEYGRLLNDAVAAIRPEPSASSNHTVLAAVMRFGQDSRTLSRIQSITLAVNVSLGDSIVWWRVCVLWRRKFIVALGLVLVSCTFGFGVVSSAHWQITVYTPPLLSFDDVYGGVSTFLSLLTNLIATSLIGQKAWKHRQLLRIASKGRLNTPVMKVLTLLVESGIVYSILVGLAVFTIILSRSKLAHIAAAMKLFSGLTVFFSGCFVPILALYPIIIIFIVALNRSTIDRNLTNLDTNPSNISTDMLPTLVFEGVKSYDGYVVSNPSEGHSVEASSSK